MILFTDGEPNHGRNFDKKVATDAVNKARELKTATTKTTIYTVGVFKNLSEDVNLYMSSVSSNYPNASAQYNNKGKTWKVSDGGSDFGKYYMNATSPVDLLKAFETISSEVSGGELGAEAVLTDVIAPNFALVVPEGTTGVTAYTVDKTADGWSTQKTTLTNGVTIGADGQVSVTGFDYSENCVTTTAKPTTNDYGKKLVVEFTIHHNNYGGTQPTNAGASIKDEGNKDVITVDNPTVPVTISKPDDVFTQANEKTYNGSGFDILSEVATKANTLADGTNNAFVDIEVKITVEGTDYIYTISKGQQSGTWNQTASPKTSPNVKDEDKNGTPEAYEYPVTITFKDAAEGSNALNSTTATAKFKIKYAEATVKANNKSKKATEPDPDFDATVEGMVNGEDAAQKLTYTISRTDADNNTVGDHTTITPAGKPYQNNYKVTYETGTLTITEGDPTATEFSLTGKFQKTLNSNTADVPSKSFELTITGTSDNTGKTTISGTADIGTLAKQGDKYTGSAYFGFSSALKFSTDGTYKYKVQETKGNVAGMSYDTTEYELVIEVENKNGALEIKSATIGSTDMKNGGPLTITNTFTAATLPLDPPTDPTTGTGTGKIVKNLRLTGGTEKTKEEMKFNVTVKDESNKVVANGEARVPAGSGDNTTVNFTNLDTLIFPAADEYTYTVKETAGNISGVAYDAKTYTLKVKVEASETDNSLSVTKTYYSYMNEEGETVEVTSLPITITNTYTEPKNPSVVSKTVVTTDMVNDVDTLPGGLSSGIANFQGVHGITVLYPVANGNATMLEVPYNTKSVTLLYKITINPGTATEMDIEDLGAWFVGPDDATVKEVTGEKDNFTVKFNEGAVSVDIYVARIFDNLVFDSNGECVVFNTVAGHRAETTVKVLDPDKLTIRFSDFVKKELTATGTKTASDVDFTVDVKGKEWITIITSAEGEEAISTYADEFDPKYSRTLTAHFDSITGGETKTAPFNGSTVEIDHAGQYFFVLTEEKGTRTGVTYDESVYTVYISVEKKEDKLVVAHVTIYKDYKLFDGNTITFHNTIDTGKDDYYPIIIPTIINKDTGMLNKTDHFAYVIGYPDGTVHPNGQITRAEVATIFFRLLRDEVRDGAFTTSNTYSDVAYGKWYNNPISTMSALGIITGYPDGTFKPNKPITRAEFAAIAARFDETQSGKSATFSDVIGHWAAKEIGIAYANDWIKGYPDGTFKPDQNITRAEAMTMINRVLERKPESPADLLTNMNKWTDNMDTSKWYYLDVQEATNSHAYTRKTFNYELWRQMLPDPDWSRYER